MMPMANPRNTNSAAAMYRAISAARDIGACLTHTHLARAKAAVTRPISALPIFIYFVNAAWRLTNHVNRHDLRGLNGGNSF